MRVTLVLTHHCNLACSYCYTGEKFAKTMPDKVAKEALRMGFRQMAAGERLTVSYFGGEPLLEFDRMQRYTRLAYRMARRYNVPIEFQVTTNATILSPAILEFFRSYPFRLAFSVDGIGADHDLHRPFVNGSASSDLVWRNLALAAGKLTDTSIHMVLNPETVAGLPAAVNRLAELGYRDITLLPNMDTLWDQGSRERTDSIYRQLVEVMQEFDDPNDPLIISPIYDMGLEAPRIKSCGFGSDDVAVAPTGALYPCARLVGTDQREAIQLGHVKTGVKPERVSALQARARAKQAGCGVEGGCACSTFMPGDVLRQLDNVRFFDQLAASVLWGMDHGVTLHV